LQNGQGLTPSGSSSYLTGFLAIDSTFFWKAGGIWALFSGLIKIHAQLKAACLRLALVHSATQEVKMLTLF